MQPAAHLHARAKPKIEMPCRRTQSTPRVPITGCAHLPLGCRLALREVPLAEATACLIGEGRSVRLVDRAEVWHPTDLCYICCQRWRG
jgi:hypothetical protein